MDSQNLMFIILAAVIAIFSFATVLAKSIMRAATYLFFVLLGTAGIYFLMGYTFLGSVQVMVYCGGIIVLFVFAIMLTKGGTDKLSENTKLKTFASALLCLAGFATFVYAIVKAKLAANSFGGVKAAVLTAPVEPHDGETNSIQDIGQMLLSTDYNGYLLPFEAVSLLLLACIVAALIIARKR